MKTGKPDLTVIIPVYNEEQVLPSTVTEIIDYCADRNWLTIFVNDGSSDSSGKILDALSLIHM